MRRILIDQARRKSSKKRGGGANRVDIEPELFAGMTEASDPDELLALDGALQAFESLDPIRARVVKLHYFSGFTLEETAEAMGISLSTAKRHWVFARSWLFGKMRAD